MTSKPKPVVSLQVSMLTSKTREAADGLVHIANTLNAHVWAEFHGARTLQIAAMPGDDPAKLAADWDSWLNPQSPPPNPFFGS